LPLAFARFTIPTAGGKEGEGNHDKE